MNNNKMQSTKTKKTNQKAGNSKTTPMWDLLIPLLLTVCVLPLVVRLAVYSCGYSQYEWYSSNDILTDFYCYYKSYFLDVIAFFALIILLFRITLYKERTKPVRQFIPLFVYCGFVMLSTVLSGNVQASMKGNFESFESCLVLISYVILLLYAYQIMEKEFDYTIIWRGIIGISIIFGVIGLFQVFHHDLLGFEWIQRLVMSATDFEIYGGEIEDTFIGNNVYLTLYNPNYAGIVLSMLFAIVFFMFLTENSKSNGNKYSGKKVCYAILSILLAVLTWFTYSRASLLIVLVTVAMSIWWIYNRRKKQQHNEGNKRGFLFLVTGILTLALVLVLTDAGMGFKFLSRMAEQNNREPLTSMLTDEEGIHIDYDEKEYLLYQDEEKLYFANQTTGELLSANLGEELLLPLGNMEKAEGTEEIQDVTGDEKGSTSDENGNAVDEAARAIGRIENDNPEIMLYIAETTLQFKVENGSYYYCNANGTLSSMTQVEAVDFHGLEYLGSARGYIWSRVLPLLDDYLFIGSGPDTFAEVFPQNDYAGKIVYADHPQRIIEKAHNDYLMKWVQTGMLSVICVVIFYGIFLVKCGKVYWYAAKDTHRVSEELSMHLRLGMGCYLACISYILASFFNDSTIQTSPFFYVFAGIAMSSVVIEKTEFFDRN